MSVPWLWVLVGFGLGIGLSLLGRGEQDVVTPSTDSAATTTIQPRDVGLGEAVLGFPDNLNVVVSPGGGRALEVATWPVQGPPGFRSIALSDLTTVGAPRFDASGQFIAAAIRAGDDLILASGRPNSFSNVANGISGFAWHDANAADLAWSTIGALFQIWISDDSGPGRMVYEIEGIQGEMVAFGDWGFAVAEITGFGTYRTHIVSPEGELIGTLDGLVTASHNSGQLIVARDGLNLLIPSVDGPPDPEGGIPIDGGDVGESVGLGSEFTRDGQRVALTGFAGVTVIDLSGDEEAVTYSIRAGSDSIDWSSDGRFLLVSSFRGVAVVDTRSGELSVILGDQTTRAVGVAPIGGP